jgi:metal-responsive CopG/Arc/MetJ family transcriptional regulator
MDRRKRIYIAIPEELLMEIDEARKTPKGEIDRTEFIVALLREALKNKPEAKQIG